MKGKTISILGASISTYTGISNNTDYNSTIGNNAVYYTAGRYGVYANDTWWMQAANDLGLRLLVNNSWSGSSLLYERSGTVGAYVDRCVQLHNNEGETPDIIGIQMGTNDFQYYKDTLGTADIDYAALIKDNGDGTYSYAEPTTSLEAAAIVLHKISIHYPNAEVYYLNISQRVDGTDELIRSFNAELKQVVEHFDAHIVDIYGSTITTENFDTYIGDGRVHPNKLGMDAYTEAFKRALIANTAYSVETHTVTMELDGVTADYGDDKIVVDSDAFTVDLTAGGDEELDVTVTMGGKDITASAYSQGTVTIDAVTANVTITAEATDHIARNYRWEFDGTDLVCVSGDNALTKNASTTTDGVFSKTRYALTNAVVLSHDQPWVVEWKCEGTFLNANGSSGARVFTSTDANADYKARYIFKSNTNGIIAMGEKTTSGSHNYGIALADYGIDWTALHTYCLENRIAEDGSNMVYLYVDGAEIGPMNHYYVGTTDKNTTSDWLSGKEFVFPYMGTDTHGFTNASIEYIQVWEGGKPNQSQLTDYSGKVISILGDSISTFAGYIPVADGFNLAHKTRYPQDDLLTDVNEPWWMQTSAELDGKLGINDSWASSEVYNYIDEEVNSTSDGTKACMASLTRIQNLGSNGTPDVILFFGGTNDITQSRPLGTFDTSTAPTEVDLTSVKWNTVADAYVDAIMRMQYYYPDAQIVAMLPYYRNSQGTEKVNQYNSLFISICEHYGVPYVDLRQCGISNNDLPDGTHPDATGMDYITAAALDVLMSDCHVAAGEHIVHSVTHNLTDAKSSLGYYKGVSHGKSFVTTISGERLQVTVTMGGVDITSDCYADGVVTIENVTGDLVITAIGAHKTVYADYLQELPENICSSSNLWTALEPINLYYRSTGWGVNATGLAHSITFSVSAGEQIWATSFQASGINGGTKHGIALTWFDEEGAIETLSPEKTYAEFAANGYLTAPEGAVAVNVVMWNGDESNEVYILNRIHAYKSTHTEPTCTDQGYVTHTCTACGDSYADAYVDATGHTMGEWYETIAPGEETPGEERRDCVDCQHYETGEISATGPLYLRGDVNGDGKVDWDDIYALRLFLAEADVVVVPEVIDPNADGVVNMRDVARLAQYLSGVKVERIRQITPRLDGIRPKR